MQMPRPTPNNRHTCLQITPSAVQVAFLCSVVSLASAKPLRCLQLQHFHHSLIRGEGLLHTSQALLHGTVCWRASKNPFSVFHECAGKVQRAIAKCMWCQVQIECDEGRRTPKIKHHFFYPFASYYMQSHFQHACETFLGGDSFTKKLRLDETKIQQS